LQVAVLGSGSRGNATLVRSGKTCLMVDCGFSVKETEARLARLDCPADSISALLVTHEHSDHSKGVGAFSRKYKIPVWMTRGTATSARFGKLSEFTRLNAEQSFAVGDLQVQSYPVPHDAREPCQYCFTDGNKRLAILTDAGSTTAHMEQLISRCDALMLECNHDRDMLWEGEYPQHLKERVAGRFGHLSNHQAAEFLNRIDTSMLNQLVAMHLSEKNNTQALANLALCDALDCESDWIRFAEQDEGLEWLHV